jgi:hypothetical protein
VHAEEPELAELGHELAAEVLRLEVAVDDREDALLGETTCALLPLAFFIGDERVEIEDGVDARGGGRRGHPDPSFDAVRASQSAPPC